MNFFKHRSLLKNTKKIDLHTYITFYSKTYSKAHIYSLFPSFLHEKSYIILVLSVANREGKESKICIILIPLALKKR